MTTSGSQESPPLLSRRIADALTNGGAADAVEYAGRWYSWADLREIGQQVDQGIAQARPGAMRVGLVARNRATELAAILGLMASGRTVVMIHAAQKEARFAAEVEALNVDAIVADAQYWTPAVQAAARAHGVMQVHLSDDVAGRVTIIDDGMVPAAVATGYPEAAVELLSSGTTGAPKRIPISWKTLGAALGAAHGTATFGGSGIDWARAAQLPPAISGLSLGNIGGIYMVLPSALIGQRMVLLDKFAVEPWVRAVSLYRPELLSVQPVGLRMILQAGVQREALQSLRTIVSGASPLEPELQDEFERRYGIRVFGAYGATEFCGSIVFWTDELYDRHRDSKRGSVGRAGPGVQVRVADPDSGALLPAGETGLLEARVERVGADWIRTTDLAVIDEDDFVYIKGRSDNAINRGGYKVVPDEVVSVLRLHPAVFDAAVVGLADDRLGEVPVAVIELKSGQTAPSEAELHQHARQHLLAYQVPTRFLIAEQLPRNASLKVMAPAVRALFEAADSAARQA
jgi:acyl-CoA synthetase (AMP-forming)/AMP-acid ligase II